MPVDDTRPGRASSKGDLQATSTIQPKAAVLRIATSKAKKDLSEDQWSALSVDLNSIWNAVDSARADMLENLQAYTALYEMQVEEQEWPWENAANLVLPIVPSELDTMLANVAGQVFVQRLIVVTPGDDDPETARLAPQVEKYYNAELRRIRADGKTPIEQFITILHLALRDGGGPCDVFFIERKVPRLIVTDEPKIDGDQVVMGDDGEIATERVVTRIEETVREVTVEPCLLRDWSLVPAESTSIQSALGVIKTIWMTEKEMMEKVAAGTFDRASVDQVLDWVPNGTTDVASDPDGSYDKSAGGQIDIGQGQGALTSEFFRNRGPAELQRLFSDQFDMNGDGIPEKNIFWFYSRMPLLLGYEPYEYADQSWPTFCFSPLPRPDRPYGYSVVERLADLLAEANSGRNQRRNYIDLTLMPLLLQREGDTIRDKDGAFGPGVRWTVEDVDRSLKWFQPQQLSSESFQDSGELTQWIAKVTGQNAPALGAQSQGRRSATESRQQQAAQGVRTAFIAMLFRSHLRAIMQFWHKLNIQYLGADKKGPTTEVPGEGTMTLDPSVFTHKFNIDIAGLSDPTDAPARRQEILASIGVIGKAFPWILQDPEKSYELAEAFFETFQWSGTERFIGTREEAQQRKQAMAAQAAQPQPGAPGQPGQSPPQGGQPALSPPTPGAPA